ncbi:adenylate/guanylate cyclase domain-containing protein [Hwanghaeella grinnelliae]|uniref:adenylate/guanylate cyclase domain-containing protein n=1 Tax=Hwanghaeella grinnelliae TaxID=2500179 RepID=UPI001386FD37|nr:adenylate/guanylate cyclase domain-containing protein [Hwanghaeella grinnelliae]
MAEIQSIPQDDEATWERPTRVPGMSLGLKIFGASLVLVVLMILVSAASIVMVGQVRHELQVEALVFQPLADDIADIETAVLEAEVLVERLRIDMIENSLDPDMAAAVARETVALHDEIEDEILHVRDLLNDHQENVLDSDSKVVVATITARLEAVDRNHEAYHSAMEKMTENIRQGDMKLARAFNDIMSREEREIYYTLELIRAEIQSYVTQSLQKVLRLQNVLNWLIGVLTAAAASLGLLLAWVISRRIVQPVHDLVDRMHDVQTGNLDIEAKASTKDELAWLANGFNEMVAGLRAKDRITETFGKYVDARVVQGLIGNPAMTRPGGDRRTMTVFFTDLAGFTSLSEMLTPDVLVRLLNEYFSTMSEPIRHEDGVIDKFIGDAIMAYWGQPFVEETAQATNAVQAGLMQRRLIHEFREKVPEILGVHLDNLDIDMRIGIATGPAVVGTVGSRAHRNYTVMGDIVNLASRLEGACKNYDLHFLVDEETWRRTDGVLFREIDSLRVKGRKMPVRIFQPLTTFALLDEQPEKRATMQSVVKAFEDGLAAYRAREFSAAETAFRHCLSIWPDDAVSTMFLKRLEHLRVDSPPEDWDGVWTLDHK